MTPKFLALIIEGKVTPFTTIEKTRKKQIALGGGIYLEFHFGGCLASSVG